mmetsp:Transcript_37142/g.89591  ORF Transcript_37142/g.89591 Transcript_37142/m.89591 type:complete len:264 (-) Transcript_37142:251-1042(-)
MDPGAGAPMDPPPPDMSRRSTFSRLLRMEPCSDVFVMTLQMVKLRLRVIALLLLMLMLLLLLLGFPADPSAAMPSSPCGAIQPSRMSSPPSSSSQPPSELEALISETFSRASSSLLLLWLPSTGMEGASAAAVAGLKYVVATASASGLLPTAAPSSSQSKQPWPSSPSSAATARPCSKTLSLPVAVVASVTPPATTKLLSSMILLFAGPSLPSASPSTASGSECCATAGADDVGTSFTTNVTESSQHDVVVGKSVVMSSLLVP